MRIAAGKSPARALVRAFTTMWRNSRIYAAAHPRVAAAVSACLEQLAAQPHAGGPLQLLVREGMLWCGPEGLPVDDIDAAHLVERLRDAGLRGLEFGPSCNEADLHTMLAHLQRHRGRASQGMLDDWPVDRSRLRPLPLVFDGHFDATAAAEPPASPPTVEPGDTAVPAARKSRPSAVAPHVRAVLERLQGDPDVTDCLRTLEQLTTDGNTGPTARIDVLERIGSLLPADVGAEADAIEAAIKTIIERVERDLHEVLRLGARVRGGGLLRLALDVARQFFTTSSTPGRVADHRPTGRPEDERITADVDLLLGELEQIERADPALPKAADGGTAREALGACVHALAQGRAPVGDDRLAELVRAAVQDQPMLLARLLDPYLRGQPALLPEAQHLQLLRVLLDLGGPPAALARRHLDAGFLAARFPAVLPMCVRALGHDLPGREVLRAGLARVGRDQLAAAERADVLRDPMVVATLLGIDGPVVRALLPAMARQAEGEALELVLEHARGLPMPPGVLAALSVPSSRNLPMGYLPRVLAAFLAHDPELDVDAESATILRNRVMRLENGRLAELLLAIEVLVHAPGRATVELLRRLARRRWFAPWDGRARAIRRQARFTLWQLQRSS